MKKKNRSSELPWIVYVPEGINPNDLDFSLLQLALPGDHGILLVPAETSGAVLNNELVQRMQAALRDED